MLISNYSCRVTFHAFTKDTRYIEVIKLSAHADAPFIKSAIVQFRAFAILLSKSTEILFLLLSALLICAWVVWDFSASSDCNKPNCWRLSFMFWPIVILSLLSILTLVNSYCTIIFKGFYALEYIVCVYYTLEFSKKLGGYLWLKEFVN